MPASIEEPVMPALHDQILENLQTLPEPALQEVLTFIDFLSWRTQSRQIDPLRSVIGSLSVQLIAAEEIDDEVYGE